MATTVEVGDSIPTMGQAGDTASTTDEPIVPDSYWGGEGGTVPIFKPTMEQFRSFPDFIKKIDHYGMKSGIVKVIPPQEWLDSLPELDEKVKTIRVQNAIEQNFAGTGGAFRQMNLEKHRSYSLPQWRKICDSSEHQPPAKRGEARRMGGRRSSKKEAPVRTPVTPPATTDSDSGSPEPRETAKATKKTKAGTRQSTDEAEFVEFDYRIDDNEQYTPERCQELEKSYWKSLTFNQPMYGADLPGSLFDDSTESWNVAKLDNILNRLGVVLPGVNSAYLYLGMWKATFSWHVEDMDLYSINYIHFGAPKQWYSVSQEDNQKFEKVMKDIFPNDARHCGQFMRHKTFGASPARLAQHDLHVNKLVHYEKEFVITFPYGYHSGYNLGYNCAESVNFATEEWLEYGRVARKCECVTDAVSIDVNDIIRAVNGGTVEVSSDEDEDEMLTPPASDEDSDDEPTERKTYSEFERSRRPNMKKRSRDVLYDTAPVTQYKKLSDKYHARSAGGKTHHPSPTKPLLKKIKLSMPKAPCALCNRDPIHEELLDAGGKRKVHRVCAELIPETQVVVGASQGERDTVLGYDDIDKARRSLRCVYCKTVSGACFQCSSAKCVRAFHGTCAYDAGVLVQAVDTAPGEPTSYHFLCKSHRPRRPPLENLEFDINITQYSATLQIGRPVQAQFASGHVFSGIVRENRRSERSLLVEVGNEGDKIEVDYQWILAPPRKIPTTRTPSNQAAPSVVADLPEVVQAPPPVISPLPSPTVMQPSQQNAQQIFPQNNHYSSYINPYSVAQGKFMVDNRSQSWQASTGQSHVALPRPAVHSSMQQTGTGLLRAWSHTMMQEAVPQNAVAQLHGVQRPSLGQYQPGVPMYFRPGMDLPVGTSTGQR